MTQSKISRFVIVMTVFLIMTACGANPNGTMDNGRNSNGNRVDTNDVRQYAHNLRNTDNNNQGMNYRRNNDGFGNNGYNGYNNNIDNIHNNSRVELSEEIADQIADMKEVDSANVLVTDENVYVAVVLENGVMNRSRNNLRNQNQDNGNRVNVRARGENMPGGLKDKIANKVQSLKPNVDNVYVSANPDFVDRVNGFVDQVQEGRPIQGLINEFNTMVGRMFPTNAGPDQNNNNNNNR